MASRSAKVAFLVCLQAASASWKVGEWSSCSAKCGNGTQSRHVGCNAADSECDVTAKPVASASCRGTGCPWDVTRVNGWGKCSNGCGRGLQLSKPVCNCPMPCYLPNDRECEGTPLPPSSSLLVRRCFGTIMNSPDRYCSNCSASGRRCLSCSLDFKLNGGKCEVVSRTIRQELSLRATSQLLSPMSRAVALAIALEQTFLALTNASASVVSMKSEATKNADFLSARRLGTSRCKKVRVVSQGGESPLGNVEFYLDGEIVPFPNKSRGIAVAILDPDTHKILGTPASFDTYSSEAAVSSLTNYLNKLRDGYIVLIGVDDSGLENLNRDAIAAFHRIGAAMQDLGNGKGFRRPYAFIGQLGVPSMKEAVGLAASTKVDIESHLPCNWPSTVNVVMVAQDANKASLTTATPDVSLSRLATRLGKLNATDVMEHLSTRLRTLDIELPVGMSMQMDGLSEICPDHMVWTNDACTTPRTPGSITDGFKMWWPLLILLAVALLLCCFGAICFKRCKHREIDEAPLTTDGTNPAQDPRGFILAIAHWKSLDDAISKEAQRAANQARNLSHTPDDVGKIAAAAAKTAGGSATRVADEASKAAAATAIAFGHEPKKVAKAAEQAAKAAGARQDQVARLAGSAAANLAKDPIEAANSAAAASKASGGSAAVVSKSAADAAANATKHLQKKPEEIAHETMKAAKAAGASLADASKAAADATKHSVTKTAKSPLEAAKKAMSATKAAGVSLVHSRQAASDAAARTAKIAGKSANDVAKQAAGAAKTVGGNAHVVSKLAADAAATVATEAANSPSDAAGIALKAAKAAGASAQHAAAAAADAASDVAVKSGYPPARVGKVAADVVKAAGGSTADAARAAGTAAVRSAKDAGMGPAEIAKHAAEAARSASASTADGSKAAADAASQAVRYFARNPQEAGQSAAKAARDAGASPEDAAKAAGSAAAFVAESMGQTPGETAKAAADATKLAGGTVAHASEVAADAAHIAAAHVAQSKEEAEKIAEQAAIEAGSTNEHIRNAWSRFLTWAHL